MKIASPQIIHKSDAGGVKVNLTNDAEVSCFQNYYQKCKKLQQESRNQRCPDCRDGQRRKS